jgi:hypothetical protein
VKRAVVIGIDEYPAHPLKGCVSDAVEVASMLKTNSNGDPNFEVLVLTSDDAEVTSVALVDALDALFTGDAETVLFYFAGHGVIDPGTQSGFVVAQNGSRGAWGLSLTDLVNRANSAYPHIKSSVIILDCCHAGFAAEVAKLGSEGASIIGSGVTILTATHRDGMAHESDGHGLFTKIMLDGLRGSASDILGNVTPAALYSLVDQTLGFSGKNQRPIYKANVQNFITLRQVDPKVPKEVLRSLPRLFPKAAAEYALDPSYEPNRDNVPEDIHMIPPNPDHVRIFKGLQACNRNGLVVPVGTDAMYYAAIESKSCRLTATGAHYRKLAELGKI